MHIHPLDVGKQDPATWRIARDIVPFSVSLEPTTPSGGVHLQSLLIRRTINEDPVLRKAFAFDEKDCRTRLRLGATVFCLGSEPRATYLWTCPKETNLDLPVPCPLTRHPKVLAQIDAPLQPLFDMAVDLTAPHILDQALEAVGKPLIALIAEEALLGREVRDLRANIQIAKSLLAANGATRYETRMKEIGKRLEAIQRERSRLEPVCHLLEIAKERRTMKPEERKEQAACTARVLNSFKSFPPPRP